MDASRYDSFITLVSFHSVSLPGAGLTVGENADFVSVEGAFDEFGDFFEDGFLAGFVWEDVVEIEGVFLRSLCQDALLRRTVNRQSVSVFELYFGFFLFLLTVQLPSYSAKHSDVPLYF